MTDSPISEEKVVLQNDPVEDKHSSVGNMTQNVLKTPEFISENKSLATYERDLKRWSRLTTLKKNQQAEWIVLHLEGHPLGI